MPADQVDLRMVTVLLMVWSLTLSAPLEEPSNPNVTMNPAKAPWYFLGLQEMLVYFDPWMAGVVMPTLIIVGLMAIPYIDANPLGNGYYTYKQRKYAIWTFLIGFIGLWVAMITIGTFIRGPGWMWFWPTEVWDAEQRYRREHHAWTTSLSDLGLTFQDVQIFTTPNLLEIHCAHSHPVLHARLVGSHVHDCSKSGGVREDYYFDQKVLGDGRDHPNLAVGERRSRA